MLWRTRVRMLIYCAFCTCNHIWLLYQYQVETLIPMLLQDQDAIEGGAGRLKRVVSF
jgi:hypothetical protein